VRRQLNGHPLLRRLLILTSRQALGHLPYTSLSTQLHCATTDHIPYSAVSLTVLRIASPETQGRDIGWAKAAEQPSSSSRTSSSPSMAQLSTASAIVTTQGSSKGGILPMSPRHHEDQGTFPHTLTLHLASEPQASQATPATTPPSADTSRKSGRKRSLPQLPCTTPGHLQVIPAKNKADECRPSSPYQGHHPGVP